MIEYRRGWPYMTLIAFGLGLVLLFLFREYRLTGRLDGVPLDDSWIHYRFAANFRNGDGFGFNRGQPTPGSTAPLWAGILALVGSGYLIPSKVIGMLAYLAVGVMNYRLGLQMGLFKPFALLAGLGTLAAGRLVWSAPSGMETTVFTLFSLVCLMAWGRSSQGEISSDTSILIGLACMLRPEGYLLLGLSGLDWAIHHRGQPGWSKALIKHLALASMVILPYLVFSLLTTGHLLPNTFYAKSSTWACRPGPGYFVWIVLAFLADNPVLTTLAAGGLIWSLQSGAWKTNPSISLGGAWCLGLPLAYGILAPCTSSYYLRYTTPLIPVVMYFGVLGTQKASEWFALRRSREARRAEGKNRFGSSPGSGLGLALGFEGVLLALIPTLWFWAPFYGQSVADIGAMHIRIGKWLAEHSQPGQLVALNDVGAIGSLADREVIDLMGLTSPEVIHLVAGKSPGVWDAALADYLSQRRPDYLVVFPNWFPLMVKELPLEPVYAVSLPERRIAGIDNLTVAGGGKMVVYKCLWPGLK